MQVFIAVSLSNLNTLLQCHGNHIFLEQLLVSHICLKKFELCLTTNGNVVEIQAPVFKPFKHVAYLRNNPELLFNWDLKQLTHTFSTSIFLYFQSQAPTFKMCQECLAYGAADSQLS